MDSCRIEWYGDIRGSITRAALVRNTVQVRVIAARYGFKISTTLALEHCKRFSVSPGPSSDSRRTRLIKYNSGSYEDFSGHGAGNAYVVRTRRQ